MPLIETKSALNNLLDLLKCENCNAALHECSSTGVCEHILCSSCFRGKNAKKSICPLCKVPYAPADVFTHHQMTQIVVATRRLLKLAESVAPKIGETFIKPAPVFNKQEQRQTRPGNITAKAVAKRVTSPVPPKNPKVKILRASAPVASPEKSMLSDTKTPRAKARRASLKPNLKGETPLHLACMKNKLATVMDLLKNNHEVNVRDNAGWTPLHEAALKGYDPIVTELVKAGAIVDIPAGPALDTPLGEAVANGRLSTVKLLLDVGADPLYKNSESLTCLDLCQHVINQLKLKSCSNTLLDRYDEIQTVLTKHTADRSLLQPG
ncbi:hypothetical protein Ciccas_012553 [Cichlidogyrus casuarinus]|uniref:RING-type domain-containing protein n=1 Tax=Cichlidogyrus casuarinus TaxID=1844966 RepID=A0ABD2PN24_9PLAT